jgi:menaquinone-dependent protoporphyrinogen oxidase
VSRVLVAYATKNGSTAEIADAIADELRGRGAEVDCRDAGTVRDVDSYDAVVLGSAVYMKRWRKEARRFLRRHRRELGELPFWVFSSGPVGEQKQGDTKAAEWAEPRRMVATVERLGAREHVIFGGRVPLEPTNFIERAMLENTPPEFADRRDWDQIRGWAAGIAEAVGRAPVQVSF